MRLAAALACAVLLPLSGGAAVDLRARSTSSSKQFTIYCEDTAIRARVTGFVEEVKRDVLELLGESDRWNVPIVVTIDPAASPTPVTLNFLQTPDGPSIQLGVRIGSDPAAVHLQKHIMRAVMLDYIYRSRPMPASGKEYVEAPWWFISGAIACIRERDTGLNTGLFRRLVDTNKLPPVQAFLAGHGDELGPTAAAFDSACAMAFLQLLVEQPDGRMRLARLMRTWPDTSRDPVEAVCSAFPSLGGDAAALQKWWTLNLARFAASDRFLGMAALETDKELSGLLEFDVKIDKAGSKERFSVARFAEWIGRPGGRAAAAAQQKAIIQLSARANALMRPVLAGYEQIFSLLARGKTRGVADRIHRIETYRTTVLHRTDEIADYLNWYEATQMGMQSDAFESYLRAADAVDALPAHTQTSDAISKYLDLIEKEL